MTKRGLSRKELEELKKREETEAAASVFEEFVATFQEDSSKVSKVWVKAGTYDAGQKKEDTKDKGKLYKPVSKLTATESSSAKPKLLETKESKDKNLLKKDKKKSNLEMFKEELRAIQEEREERHRLKANLKPSRFEPVAAVSPSTNKSALNTIGVLCSEEKTGSFDVGDPNTTNIYLGNINPKMTEQQLMEIFGKYGPLASVKVMWPRTEEEKARNRNCGFVAFMNRKDAERAMKKLNGKDIMSYEMKLGWGKMLPIPPRPIFIPPVLLESTLPPPPTGLPFNAIPASQDVSQIPPPGTPYPSQGDALVNFNKGDPANKWRTEEFRMFKGGSIWKPPSLNPFSQGMPDDLFSSDEEDDESRRRSLSKSQKKRLELMLRKLTPEKSKVADAMIFCIEHAEASEEIIDFITESLNSPKTAISKKLGRFFLVSDVLYNSSAKAVNASNFRSGFHSRMIEIISYMHQTFEATESRLKAEAYRQRVMLCFRAWEEWNVYPADFLIHLQNVFLGLASSEQDIPKLVSGNEDVDGVPLDENEEIDGAPLSDTEDLDGIPLDGAALLRSAVKLQSGSPALTFNVTKSSKYDEDVDGMPMEDLDGVPMATSPSSSNRRERAKRDIKNKWEVDVSPPALATSKWDNLDQEPDGDEPSRKRSKVKEVEDIFVDTDSSIRSRKMLSSEEEIDGGIYQLETSSEAVTPQSSDSRGEDRRGKLREVELKVVKYQDELEAGVKSRVSGLSVSEQVQQYREHLLRKVMRDHSSDTRESRDKDSRDRRHEKTDRSTRGTAERDRHAKDKDRRRLSTSRSRSRSRSPKKSSRTKRGRSSRSSSPGRSSSRRSPRRSRSKSDSPRKSHRSRSRTSSPRRTPSSKSSKKSKH